MDSKGCIVIIWFWFSRFFSFKINRMNWFFFQEDHDHVEQLKMQIQEREKELQKKRECVKNMKKRIVEKKRELLSESTAFLVVGISSI